MPYDSMAKQPITKLGSGSKNCDTYFEILDTIFVGLSAIENKLSTVLGVYKTASKPPVPFPETDIPVEQVNNKLKEVEERISIIRERLDETL